VLTDLSQAWPVSKHSLEQQVHRLVAAWVHAPPNPTTTLTPPHQHPSLTCPRMQRRRSSGSQRSTPCGGRRWV
jgi:hypothetical protein